MYKLDYNPVSKRWQDRMDGLPEEIKRQIDTPIGKENLKVLRRIRKIDVKEGDIFVCSMNGNVFYYGKVLKSNIQHKNPSDWVNGGNVVFIFRCKTSKKDLSDFSPDYKKLLIEPCIVLTRYWNKGFFETIGNIPLTDEEKKLDYGFFKSFILGNGGYFIKESGEEIDHMPDIYSIFGIMVDSGIYKLIKNETILDPTLLTI